MILFRRDGMVHDGMEWDASCGMGRVLWNGTCFMEWDVLHGMERVHGIGRISWDGVWWGGCWLRLRSGGTGWREKTARRTSSNCRR